MSGDMEKASRHRTRVGQKQKSTCGAQSAPLRTSEPREKIASLGPGM
jgi:hypothetical protein